MMDYRLHFVLIPVSYTHLYTSARYIKALEEPKFQELRQILDSDETPEKLVNEFNKYIDVYKRQEYDYPNFHLSMDCFWCEIIHGELILKEAEDAKWLTREQMCIRDRP